MNEFMDWDDTAPNEDDIPIGVDPDAREPYNELQEEPIKARVAIGIETDTHSDGGIVPFQSASGGADIVALLPFDERKTHDKLVADGFVATVYDYRDEVGRTIMLIVQYRKSGARKIVRPLRYCGRARDGKPIYWWTGIPGTHPIYGLQDLAQRPDAPVLCVEGEKTADAARMQFPDHVVICWPGGAGTNAVDRADVTPLEGRQLIGWPDNDNPGRAGMRRFLARALEAGASSAAIVPVPAEYPAKWDLADSSAALGGPEAVAAQIEKAVPISRSAARRLLANPRREAASRRILGLAVGYSRVERDAVETCLSLIDPDQSGLWFRILRCLYFAYGLAGLDLADAWSQRGPKYRSGEPKRLFDGFAKEPNFGADTLYWLFQQAQFRIREAADADTPVNSKLDYKAFAKAHIEDLNRDHAIVTRGSKTVVMWETFDERFDRYTLEYLPKSSFVDRLVNLVPVADGKDGPVFKPRGSHWFGDGRRRQYEKIVFLPGRETGKSSLNAWRGFTVEPIMDPDGWSLFKDHLLNNVCNGDQACFEYLMNWLAACVQRLGQPLGVALVLTGHKGAGKSIVIQFLAQLFGEAAFVTSLADDVLGKFNARLEHTLLLGLEEAVAASNRAQDGTLKDLITRDTLRLEDKFFSNWTAPNHLRLIMTSNNDFVVRADARERRYAVFEVSNPHQDDPDARRKYFGDMVEQMESGGCSAMLGELLARDISAWNHERIPETEALRQQKMLNLANDPVAAWWFSRLEDGVNILAGEAGTPVYAWSATENVWVPVAEVTADYRAYAKANGYRTDDRRIKTKLSRFMPQGFEAKVRRDEGDLQRQPARMYPIPPLAEAKALFERATGYVVEGGAEDTS